MGSSQLMFIYDEDWALEFEDAAVLTGTPGGDSVSLQGYYVSDGVQFHVNGTLVQVEQDYMVGDLYRDVVGVCTEQQAVDAYRSSYEPSTFEGSFSKARILLRDDLEGMVELVTIRSDALPERVLQIDTTVGERVLVDVPAGQLRLSVSGRRAFPFEVREVFLSTVIEAR